MSKRIDSALVWFRNDLRVEDHHGLNQAIAKCDNIIAYYSFNPYHYGENKWGFKKTEKFRAKFLLQTLNDLKSELDALNISLFVFNTAAEKQMRELVKIYDVKAVYHQKEWTDEEIKKIDSLKKILPANVSVHEYYDQFLFHPDDLTIHYSETPKVFTQFRKQLEKKSFG